MKTFFFLMKGDNFPEHSMPIINEIEDQLLCDGHKKSMIHRAESTLQHMQVDLPDYGRVGHGTVRLKFPDIYLSTVARALNYWDGRSAFGTIDMEAVRKMFHQRRPRVGVHDPPCEEVVLVVWDLERLVIDHLQRFPAGLIANWRGVMEWRSPQDLVITGSDLLPMTNGEMKLLGRPHALMREYCSCKIAMQVNDFRQAMSHF